MLSSVFCVLFTLYGKKVEDKNKTLGSCQKGHTEKLTE